jgi:hypothetical protein
MDGTTIRLVCVALALVLGVLIFMRRRGKTE